MKEILGTNKGPAHLPLGQTSPYLEKFLNSSNEEINKFINEFHKEHDVSWSISGDRENRVDLYQINENIINEGRTIHLGIDIIAPAGSALYSPFDSQVEHVEYDKGDGNYGWFIVLRTIIKDEPIYLLFGHLARDGLAAVGTQLVKGERFGFIGDTHENGNWFHHTHLQVLTQRGFDEGWVYKGLCTKEQLLTIDQFCPSPGKIFSQVNSSRPK